MSKPFIFATVITLLAGGAASHAGGTAGASSAPTDRRHSAVAIASSGARSLDGVRPMSFHEFRKGIVMQIADVRSKVADGKMPGSFARHTLSRLSAILRMSKKDYLQQSVTIRQMDRLIHEKRIGGGH